MNRKILVLTEGNIYERRGYFNAVVSRTKYLKDICNYEIDILLLATYEPWLVRKLRHTQKQAMPMVLHVDGLTMKIDWSRFSLVDYILNVKLHKSTIYRKIHNAKIAKKLKGYELIIAHSIDCGIIAQYVKEQYGTPYTVTWHGSDIHSEPFNNPSRMQPTIDVIENANINFFVSKALLETSKKITIDGNKRLLYNGYNEMFRRYPDNERTSLKVKFGIADKKVVVFAGGFLEVKNILIIPLIFKAIYDRFQNVEFWMIGDGKFRLQVEDLSNGLPIRFWGNQEPEDMPDFFNASDVLILPSKNEGLPLTVVEGLASGCNVVGSRVGGIPEVIGEENSISLANPDFVEVFADKVVEYLVSPVHIDQPLNAQFSWNVSAQREYQLIKEFFND